MPEKEKHSLLSNPTLKNAGELAFMYGSWIAVHAAAANAYPYFCAHSSVLGLITSPFYAPAPHCKALLWCVNAGSAGVDAMWVTFGTWCSTKILRKFWNILEHCLWVIHLV